MTDATREITVPGPPELHEVAAGVYAYIQPDGTWWINNTGFLAGPQGVISIDACSTRRRTEAYAQAIAPPGALPFWQQADWGDLTTEPPFVTFTDEITLHSGDTRAQVRYVGTPAHTTNDSIAWLPGPSVLFCGDLVFNGGTPFLLMGSVAGAIEVLEQVIIPLGARVTVPGHGPVFEGAAPVAATLRYLRMVTDLAAASLAAGLSPLDAAREADLGEFAGWPDAERIVGNLYRARAEIGGAPRGAPVDLAAALSDMVAYNGGEPLTCLA